MSAYVIVYYKSIADAEAVKRYAKAAWPSLKAHGAMPLAGNVPGICLEGSQAPLNTILMEFPDVEAAQAWYRSPEYQEAAKLRANMADVDIVLVNGISKAG